MTNTQLKNLKDTLWATADQLRANSGLKSTEYAEPILGLIFLRFADVKYSKYEAEIKLEFEKNKGTRMERPIHEIAIEKCGFYLPKESRYDWLLNLPESENLAQKVKEAMQDIEKYTSELYDTLPKDIYYSVNSQDDPLVLAKLLKAFKDIPADVELDIFGEIYEYFLGKFALAEGQGGGEFFTPSTVVSYMVEVLAPTEGKILDPACGSGGMFVQTAHYIERHKAKGNQINLRAYGVEKTGATVKLARMNLVLNNVRGTITEANSYYRDPYNSFGNFDYVMANPPFNVDEVELDGVKDQPRFNTYGVPQNKTKSKKKDAKETVPNANYLWINQFATALNEHGRAALVMANSASDAGNSEKDIRMRLIESGIISQMVTLPSNMFTSVTLPATLWFFNRAKEKKDEILFIDARNIFTQVDRAHRKFSDEQIQNLGIITRLYEGKTEEFNILINEYKEKVLSLYKKYVYLQKDFSNKIFELDIESCNYCIKEFNDDRYKCKKNLCDYCGLKEFDYDLFEIEVSNFTQINKQKDLLSKNTTELWEQFHDVERLIHHNIGHYSEFHKKAEDYLILYKEINRIYDKIIYFLDNILWLVERFPDGKYRDVVGLCKVAKIDGEDGIKDQDYSLNPGRYVGVVIEDDGLTEEEFKQKMMGYYEELSKLNEEAHGLENTIAANLQELFQ